MRDSGSNFLDWITSNGDEDKALKTFDSNLDLEA